MAAQSSRWWTVPQPPAVASQAQYSAQSMSWTCRQAWQVFNEAKPAVGHYQTPSAPASLVGHAGAGCPVPRRTVRAVWRAPRTGPFAAAFSPHCAAAGVGADALRDHREGGRGKGAGLFGTGYLCLQHVDTVGLATAPRDKSDRVSGSLVHRSSLDRSRMQRDWTYARGASCAPRTWGQQTIDDEWLLL